MYYNLTMNKHDENENSENHKVGSEAKHNDGIDTKHSTNNEEKNNNKNNNPNEFQDYAEKYLSTEQAHTTDTPKSDSSINVSQNYTVSLSTLASSENKHNSETNKSSAETKHNSETNKSIHPEKTENNHKVISIDKTEDTVQNLENTTQNTPDHKVIKKRNRLEKIKEIYKKTANIKEVDPNKDELERQYEMAKNERKHKKIVAFCLFCFIVLCVYLFALLSKYAFEDIKDDDFYLWVIELKGPPIISSLLIFCIGFIIITAASFITKQIVYNKNPQLKTVTILIVNVSKTIGYIVIFVMIMTFWKVDAALLASLVASFGVAIGFGAQNLVKDLIAGGFMAFEKSIKIGDTIDFGGFVGRVEEVGIRTLRLRDADGNVKIISNSELTSFVNRSMHRSWAMSDLAIEYNQNLVEFEKILKANLSKIGKTLQNTLGFPSYAGVIELGAHGVIVRVLVPCREEYRVRTLRDLNRQLKLLCDEHNISIAFNKIEIVNLHKEAS